MRERLREGGRKRERERERERMCYGKDIFKMVAPNFPIHYTILEINQRHTN
jgi:hypothetical protein